MNIKKSLLIAILTMSMLLAFGCTESLTGVGYSEEQTENVIDTSSNDPGITIQKVDTVGIWGELIGGPNG